MNKLISDGLFRGSKSGEYYGFLIFWATHLKVLNEKWLNVENRYDDVYDFLLDEYNVWRK